MTDTGESNDQGGSYEFMGDGEKREPDEGGFPKIVQPTELLATEEQESDEGGFPKRAEPSDLEFHESNRFTPSGGQKVALVDIDETICFYTDKRQYNLAEPSEENILKINKLFDEGWKIIYWTARGGSSLRDYYGFTWKQLEEWGCKFHELHTGTKGRFIKPPYDLVIDDKAKRIEEL